MLHNVSAVPVYNCFDKGCSTNEANAIMPTDGDSLRLLDLGSQSFSKKERETASNYHHLIMHFEIVAYAFVWQPLPNSCITPLPPLPQPIWVLRASHFPLKFLAFEIPFILRIIIKKCLQLLISNVMLKQSQYWHHWIMNECLNW